MKGFRPGTLLLGMGVVMGYGWYKLIHGVREAKYVSSHFHSHPSTTRLEYPKWQFLG